jgi:hypothetical protein
MISELVDNVVRVGQSWSQPVTSDIGVVAALAIVKQGETSFVKIEYL